MKNSTCIFPGCHGLVSARDLCAKHYSTAAQQVNRGATTWARLVNSGRVGKANARRGRKPVVRDYFLGTKKPQPKPRPRP